LDDVTGLGLAGAFGQYDEVVVLLDTLVILVEHDGGVAKVLSVRARFVGNANVGGELVRYTVLQIGLRHGIEHLGGELFASKGGVGDLLEQE
jgi:hypothetical protein